MSLSDASTSGQIVPDNNSNEEALHILHIFKAGASPSDGFMSYLGHSLVVES